MGYRDEQRRKLLREMLEEDTQVTTKLSMQELDRLVKSKPAPAKGGMKTQLIVLTGAEAGKIHILEDQELIGRDTTAGLRVTDTTVSRKHAVITKTQKGRFYIRDLGSQNGTWVNGVPVVDAAELRVGDKIRVGIKTIFLFTQQDNIELQLLELRKMESLGRLARGIAHDFNNLLATIMLNVNYIEVMKEEGVIDPEELATSLDQTKVALKQAANMTEQLLGFARKGRYEERPRNVSDILHEVVGLIRRTFDRAIEITTDIDLDLAVVGDQSQLQQVFMNLCINARDAMPSGGELKIEAHSHRLDSIPHEGGVSFLASGRHVVISVSDTGVGMDEKTRQHIFEPFFSTKGLGKGNGLGLATVYGIVKNHGGEIQVESIQGKGTTFIVYLPASEIALETADGKKRKSDPALHVLSEGSVLLVEDDERLLQITKKTLEKLGYNVVCCGDGVAAVEAYRRCYKTIRVVLLDLVLPKQGGLETFRKMKRINPDVLIVVVSGYSEDSQLRTILDEGAAAFVKKPCSANQLATVLSEVLSDEENEMKPTLISLPTVPPMKKPG